MGFALWFAPLIAAILWNLGTWGFGLPASSSPTLIGSLVGVGVAHALLRGQNGATDVECERVTKIGYAVPLSPLLGFTLSTLRLFVMKEIIRRPAPYTAPRSDAPPPPWIRGPLTSDLWPGRGGRTDRRRHPRRGRRFWPDGLDAACAVVRRRGHDGGRTGQACNDGLRTIALAWVLTLRAAILLSGVLNAAFRNIF